MANQNTRTVFVVGAGGSNVYGYPTGAELTRHICDSPRGDQVRYEVLCELAGSKEIFDKFRDRFWYSETYSIDAFLKHNPEFMMIGKYAIAQQLIRFEDEVNLFSKSNNSDHWYRKIFNEMDSMLKSDWLSLPDDQFTIITFNYDRSLRHYLQMKFSNLFRNQLGEQEIREIIRRLHIIHVHGSLGSLPYDDPKGRPYGKTLNKEIVIEAAKFIRLYDDTKNHPAADLHIKTIQDRISEANRILFLGFSFHPDNMEILGPLRKPAVQEQPFLITTTIGLSQSERNRISKYGPFRNLAENREYGMMDVLSNWNYLR